MSDFAYFRFLSAKMLTPDEERDKDEIISLTEQVLDARGIECDAKIAKMPEDQVREILEEVRRRRLVRKKKKKRSQTTIPPRQRHHQPPRRTRASMWSEGPE